MIYNVLFYLLLHLLYFQYGDDIRDTFSSATSRFSGIRIVLYDIQVSIRLELSLMIFIHSYFVLPLLFLVLRLKDLLHPYHK